MKHFAAKKHSSDLLASLLLFGLYVLLLLLLLLFAARAYRNAVQGTDENSNLRTAMSYLTVKIRQHDNDTDVFTDTIEDTEALCLTDKIDGQTYITYIYLYDGELKELFTTRQSDAALSMGTTIASLVSFSIDETPEHFYRISLTDHNGHTGSLLLHPGTPV